MTEDFALLSLRFLLNEMSPEERDVFDKRLQLNPGDCALFKAYADALAAHAEKEAGAGGELSLERAMLVLSKLEPEPQDKPKAGQRNFGAGKHLFWPVAAAVLLAFNVWQLALRIQTSNTKGTVTESAATEAQGAKQLYGVKGSAATGSEGNSAGTKGPNIKTGELAALLEKHEQLKAECEELQAIKEGLSAESHRILMKMRTLSVSGSTGNSIAAMELVTPSKFASGERRGLLEAARKILSTQGGVTNNGAYGAGATGSSSTGIDHNGNTTLSTTSNTSVPPTTGVPNPSSGTNQARESQSSDAGSLIVLGAVMQSTSGVTAGTVAEPYAWTVMDGSSTEGCINFYNLPATGAAEALVLWTKSADEGSGFVRVDSLPSALSGKSGTVFFKSADGSLPVEILVTKESAGKVPAVPSGTVVLRGP